MSSNYFEHQELVKKFSLLVTKEIPSLRVFDRHVGLFYAKRFYKGIVDYTPVKINRPGMADQYGLYNSGSSGIIHLEFEFKTGNARQTKDQKVWQSFIESMGGGYFLIRNEHQGIWDIKNYLTKKGYLKWI